MERFGYALQHCTACAAAVSCVSLLQKEGFILYGTNRNGKIRPGGWYGAGGRPSRDCLWCRP